MPASLSLTPHTQHFHHLLSSGPSLSPALGSQLYNCIRINASAHSLGLSEGRTWAHRGVQRSMAATQPDQMNQSCFKSISEQLHRACSHSLYPRTFPKQPCCPPTTHPPANTTANSVHSHAGPLAPDHSCTTPKVAQKLLGSQVHLWLPHLLSHLHTHFFLPFPGL